MEQFPASYNRFLIQGAMDYCCRVLARLEVQQEPHQALLNEVRRFVTGLEALCRQYSGEVSTSFARLDLRMIEDRFELIQDKASQLAIFPRLRDASLQQLLAP
ncbi:MAG: hypothetical protein L0312_01195 [Acidobacteria bacterium]|nr:hypothetical protein [Acidobacteriota bacterium]